jgi:hypothetical protein
MHSALRKAMGGCCNSIAAGVGRMLFQFGTPLLVFLDTVDKDRVRRMHSKATLTSTRQVHGGGKWSGADLV